MKIFLTGGAGFIGSHIAVELLSRGHELTLLARNPPKIPSLAAKTRMVRGDLQDEELIRQVMSGHEACIHNALIWDEEPTELQMKDTRAAAAIFSAAADAGVSRLIYTSSTAVHRPFLPFMNEEAPIRPSDFYGATKAAGEAFLLAFSHQSQMLCNVVRAGPAVGAPAAPDAPFKVDRRLREIVETVVRGEDLAIPAGEGRQFVGAPDLARLYAAILESLVNRQAYIAVANQPTTWEAIARYAILRSGSASTISHLPEVPPFRFDVSKLERDFGLVFDAQPHVEAAIRHLVK